MSGENASRKAVREPVLSPVDRVSELLFGLFMALTFVGAVSVTDAGQEEIRSMFAAALGCNLAWGLVDAVMYLVRTVTDRGRSLTLIRSVRAAADAETGRRLIERSLSRDVAGLVSPAEVEAIRGRIAALTSLPARPKLNRDDLLAALAIFLIVVASTFPVVLPFALIAGCRNGEERIPRHRPRHAVLRGARARALRGLRQLEGRAHDGGAGHGARGRDQRARRMKAALRAIAALAAVMATAALAGEDDPSGRRASAAEKPSWEFALTAYPTVVRGGENYTSAIAAADRGPLHLEARYNYESVGARSAFVGWTFSGGEAITWELTPLLGGAWGATQAFVPGLEASVAWEQLDFYVEAEYVRDIHERTDSYFYAWSELGFRPVEWLRAGIAGQRTNIYGGGRDIQRGPFAQLTWGASRSAATGSTRGRASRSSSA